MDDRTPLHVTVSLVGAGFLLVGVGLAGVGSSLVLAVAFAVVTALAYVAVDRLPSGALGSLDHPTYRRTVWTVPAVAALVAFGWPAASPGELQTLGGVTGLAGMANYFLRPVYHLLEDAVRWLAEA